MDGEFFGLGGDIATGSDNEKRVCLAVRVFEIEPAEEDGRSGGDALAESHPLAHPCYHWGLSVSAFRHWRGEAKNSRTVSGEDIEELEKQRVFDVTHVLCSCLLESCAVDDPPLAVERDVRQLFGGQGGTN